MTSRAWSFWLSMGLVMGCSSGNDSASTGGVNMGDGDTNDGSADDGSADGQDNGDDDGDTGGGDDGDTGGDGDPDDVCETLDVRAEKTIPDMLIVLDKSASMVWAGCDAVPDAVVCQPPVLPPYDQPFDRWAPSVTALKNITNTLQDRVRFGLMIFPDDAIPSPFPPIIPDTGCQPGFMVVNPDLNTAGAIASGLDAEQPDGESTPIAGTLKEAHDFYGPASSDPGAAQEIRYVLLVTDGGPNCSVDAQPASIFGSPSIDDCQNQAYAEVDKLRDDKVHTYVIGYDTADVPELAAVLDELATRGGTGDTQHRPVENADSLLTQIESIAGSIASCTYQLEKAPGDPAYVRVTLDGVDVPQSADGWTLRDETTIELQGSSCALLQSGGGDHTLNITVECDPVILE